MLSFLCKKIKNVEMLFSHPNIYYRTKEKRTDFKSVLFFGYKLPKRYKTNFYYKNYKDYLLNSQTGQALLKK